MLTCVVKVREKSTRNGAASAWKYLFDEGTTEVKENAARFSPRLAETIAFWCENKHFEAESEPLKGTNP